MPKLRLFNEKLDLTLGRRKDAKARPNLQAPSCAMQSHPRRFSAGETRRRNAFLVGGSPLALSPQAPATLGDEKICKDFAGKLDALSTEFECSMDDQGTHPLEASEVGFVQRREPRAETNWIALIRLQDGTEIPCNVKDVSRSGARLGVPDTVELPETFMVKVLGRDFVCLVKLAWRRGNYAGVHIERIGKLSQSDRKPPAEAAPAPAGSQARLQDRPRESRISSF